MSSSTRPTWPCSSKGCSSGRSLRGTSILTFWTPWTNRRYWTSSGKNPSTQPQHLEMQTKSMSQNSISSKANCRLQVKKGEKKWTWSTDSKDKFSKAEPMDLRTCIDYFKAKLSTTWWTMTRAKAIRKSSCCSEVPHLLPLGQEIRLISHLNSVVKSKSTTITSVNIRANSRRYNLTKQQLRSLIIGISLMRTMKSQRWTWID